jgi:chorismate mutase
MSSPKAARGKAKKAGAKVAHKKTVAKKVASTKAATADASAQAQQLAALIEKSLADGNTAPVSEHAMQDLMAALCKNYSAKIEAGDQILPLRGRTVVNSTDIIAPSVKNNKRRIVSWISFLTADAAFRLTNSIRRNSSHTRARRPTAASSTTC